MKKACRDENKVSLFFPYLNIYRALLLRIEHCTTEKSKQTSYIENTDFSIEIYIYTYTHIYIYI